MKKYRFYHFMDVYIFIEERSEIRLKYNSRACAIHLILINLYKYYYRLCRILPIN